MRACCAGSGSCRSASALGAWLGTRLLLAAPPEPFLLVLAGVILLYLNLDRLGRGSSAPVQRCRCAFGIGVRLLAGVFEAIANVAGPMLLVYFMLLGARADADGADAQPVLHGRQGHAGGDLGRRRRADAGLWAAVAALTVPSVAALVVGMRVRSRIDAVTYRRWLREALWVMAVLLIGQFIASISSS